MIPTSIVEIGEESFLDCQSLVLPLNNSMSFNLETIKASAFGGTGSLNLSAIPNRVKVIENAAFKGASTVPVS
jgi:hypothetical protein